MNVAKRHLVSSIYIFILVAFSGNPFFSIGEETSQYLFTGFVVLLIGMHLSYFNPSKKSAIPYIIYITLFILLFLIQRISLEFISIPGAIGFLLKITCGYVVIRYLGNHFKHYYFNIIFLVSIVSLFGYSLSMFGFDFPNFLSGSKETLKSIIIYTENTGDISQGIRNSGMFWEPGAFAGYICLLFLLHLGEIRILIYDNKFKVAVILMALITTFSTTGYLVLFLIGIITILKEYSRKYRIVPLLFFVMFISGSYLLYLNTDFLNEKVSNQFAAAKSLSGEFSNSRFGSFVFDLHYIEKSPIAGNGMHEKTRYADHKWLQGEQLGHGNGFSNFTASMGIMGLFIFLGYLIKYNEKSTWVFLIGIIALLQGEQFLNFPLFLCIPFIFIYENYNSSNSNVS
jgi:hypothetical protein